MAILRLLSKVPGLVWIIGAVVIAGYLWLRQHDRAVRAEAQSEVLAAQVDTLRGIVLEDSMESARKDSVIAEQQRTLYESRRELLRMESAAIANTARSSSNLRAALSAELQPLLDTVIAGYEHQLELKDEQIEIERELADLERQKVAARDTTIMAIRKLNESLEARVKQLEDRSERSVWQKAGEIAPWAALAYVLGSRSR